MDTVPGRMGFLLTLVLCKINLLNTTVVSSPRSGGRFPTAIVQWILMCLCITEIAIFEYAMILGYKKYRSTSSVFAKGMSGPAKKNDMEELFKKWDKRMIVIMPLTSIVCATIFWIIHYHS